MMDSIISNWLKTRTRTRQRTTDLPSIRHIKRARLSLPSPAPSSTASSTSCSDEEEIVEDEVSAGEQEGDVGCLTPPPPENTLPTPETTPSYSLPSQRLQDTIGAECAKEERREVISPIASEKEVVMKANTDTSEKESVSKKEDFLNSLIDATIRTLLTIYPSSSLCSSSLPSYDQTSTFNPTSTSTSTPTAISTTSPTSIPIRWFIKELLKRSRATVTTLQIALIYLSRSQGRMSALLSLPNELVTAPLLNPRKALLASLILATKYLQDQAPSNRAWARISGLGPKEVGEAERGLLAVLEWRLEVKEGEWRTGGMKKAEKISLDQSRLQGSRGQVSENASNDDATRVQTLHAPLHTPSTPLPLPTFKSESERQIRPLPVRLQSVSCAKEENRRWQLQIQGRGTTMVAH